MVFGAGCAIAMRLSGPPRLGCWFSGSVAGHCACKSSSFSVEQKENEKEKEEEDDGEKGTEGQRVLRQYTSIQSALLATVIECVYAIRMPRRNPTPSPCRLGVYIQIVQEIL